MPHTRTTVSESRARPPRDRLYRDIPRLQRSVPEPVLEIHPGTVDAAGIAEGEWAVVETAGHGEYQAQGQIQGFTAEDFVHIGRESSTRVRPPRGIGHETTSLHESSQSVHRCQPAFGREVYNPPLHRTE
jgi:hypothetical protein